MLICINIFMNIISGKNASMKGGLGGNSGSECCGYGAAGMMSTFENL